MRSFASSLASGHGVAVTDAAPAGTAPRDAYADSVRAATTRDSTWLAGLAKGAEFDRTFVMVEISAHERAVRLLQALPTPAPRALADAQAHLDRARALQRRSP